MSIADMIDKWAERFAAAAAEHGPEAVEVALIVGRIGAAREIGFGFLLLLLSAALWFGAYRCFKAGQRRVDEGERESAPGWFFGALCVAVPAFSTGIGSARFLFDLYAWVGMFRPEVWLAAKALGL